ncbi:MAG: phosphomethylpyrimidine synthase ThiC, partial [Deltaproteobacteria bacterium]|nr:phosphomethylpyrimidine synthase ThiC [Deltaproteobacteria bacterium]
MTQLEKARSGTVTPEMRTVAEREQVDVTWLMNQVAKGRVVIPANRRHERLVPCGIGEGL